MHELSEWVCMSLSIAWTVWHEGYSIISCSNMVIAVENDFIEARVQVSVTCLF